MAEVPPRGVPWTARARSLRRAPGFCYSPRAMDAALSSSVLAWYVLWAARHALWLAPVAALLPILISLLLERRLAALMQPDRAAKPEAEPVPREPVTYSGEQA